MNKKLIPLLILPFTIIACSSTNKFELKNSNQIITSENYLSGENLLHLVFAGDIMAHTNVTLKGDFDGIYKDITDITKKSDFTFANFETPVCEKKEYSSYPFFNVQNKYAQAAIDAGFNVFSLANNHSNDQDLDGILSTRDFFKNAESDSAHTERPVYACGLKDKSKDPLTYRVIKKENWTILFLAVTEILNQGSYSTWIDFINPSDAARKKFMNNLKELKTATGANLLILSFHCAEAEYIRTVPEMQKKFYKELLNSGVDILWINHPHVPKTWEVFTDDNNQPGKIIFYGVGNTISGQRFNPNFKDPGDYWEYTGDSIITSLTLELKNGTPVLKQISPVPITTYITPGKKYVIKKLNEDFIQQLKNSKQNEWAKYLEKRLELIEKIEGKIICR